MNLNPIDATFETTTLEWLKVGVQEVVSAELAASLKAEVYRDAVIDQIVYRVTAHVLADQLPPEHIERSATTQFEVAATWWQAWKEEHPRLWHGRLLRRWPVRMATYERTVTLFVDLRRYWTYPEQRVTTPNLGRPVRVALYDTDLRWTR